ncbi:MAG: hypothetical protein WA876_14110 [Candidatus Acidiferrales bacterium]
MNPKIIRMIAIGSFALVAVLGIVLSGAWSAQAQDSKAPYPRMAPISQYMMADRNAEVALARSAAPESISRDAEVLVLGRHGYETAVKGTNGFVCIVERGWTAPTDDPNFWNPKLRGPLCLNPAAARTYLPITIKKTDLILAGESKSQMADNIKAAFDTNKLPKLEPGAMCYMLSKQQYLNDGAVHDWHPHLMFFSPGTDPLAMGENAKGSPVLTSQDPLDRLTVLMVLVPKWSDGTADSVGPR